ncbi:hypothetical protein I4U23_010436 [Adineta vaga]|nr:hypothetical protein I4U23_010436 [Adineta vaga]
MPLALTFLRNNIAAYSSDGFCLFWIVATCTLDLAGIFLMAYASIERYLFIFHGNILKHHPILFRYAPFTFCAIYPLLYVIGILFLVPCQNHFIYFAFLCSGGCYLNDPFWNAMTWVGNISASVSLILLTNILLIGRTLYQKNKMKQTRVWLKNRKMVLQLVSVGILYCFAWLPSVILMLIVTFPPLNVDTEQIFFIFQYVVFMTNFPPLFYPFVCLSGQPFILNKIKNIFQRQRTAVIPFQSKNISTKNQLNPHHRRRTNRKNHILPMN